MVTDRSLYLWRKRWYWTPRLLATTVVMLPLSLQHTDFRGFGAALQVSANKNSPAYAAFEDVHQNYSATPSKFPPHLELLASGSRFQPSTIGGLRTLALKGMTVRSADAPQAFYVAGEVAHKVAKEIPNTVEVRGLVLNRDEYIPPTPATVAKELVTQELQVPSAVRREIRSVTGNTIIVAKGDFRPDPVLPPAPAPRPDPRDFEPAPEMVGYTPGPVSYISGMTTVTPTSDHAAAMWLNGQLEMTGGLAFVGAPENTLIVKRVVNGAVLEKGRIWINEGRFEIFVKTVTGQLIAELLGRDGRVLGRGEMNLVHVREIPTKDNRIYDLRIALRPTTETASLRTISGYSHGQQMIPLKQARLEIQQYTESQKVTDDGLYNDPTLTHESSYVARAVAPQHWPTLIVGQAQRQQDVRLFSNKMMEALIGLEVNNGMERKEAHLASVVWGQVRRDNKPAAGVTVEMAGGYTPIYLNELYLPDPGLRVTSSNGLFAFVQVKRGVQAVRVSSRGRTYPAQIFPTEDRHVSYIELDLEDRVVSQFKLLDVMNLTTPIEARVRMVGTEDIISIQNEGLVQYSKGADPFMVEAEAGADYEISRVTLAGKPQNIHIPMVRKAWLTDLFNKNNVLALPGRGMIVGFVDDQDFDVELTGYAPKERMQIVYFDAQGHQIQSRNGVAGGGFVIFNAPIGLQTLFVHPNHSKDTYAQVVVAEPEYVHVMSWAPGAN